MIYSRPILATFLEVCRHGNFTHAANALRKSQSCVSMQISQIEHQIGLPLFDRAARPFTLTDAGQKFQEFARAIVNAIDECSSYMKDMAAGTAGELKIGTLPSIMSFLVSPVLANVVKAYPKVGIQMTAFGPRGVYEALRQGEIHFGILLAENTPPDLIATPIRREPLYFVISGKHPIAKKRGFVSTRELRNTPFVLGSPAHEHTAMINESLRAIGVESYRVALRISNYEGMKKAIHSGIGVGFLPRFAVHEELKKGSLKQVHIKGANFTSRMVLVETPKLFSLPTVEVIKKIFIKELANSSGSSERNTAARAAVNYQVKWPSQQRSIHA